MTTTQTEPNAPANASATPKMVTLSELCDELKIRPREARMMLRLAASRKKEYPAPIEAHVPRQPWQWPQGSKALAEARKALSTPQDA